MNDLVMSNAIKSYPQNISGPSEIFGPIDIPGTGKIPGPIMLALPEPRSQFCLKILSRSGSIP